MLRTLARFAEEQGGSYALGPVRAAVGMLLGWYALTEARLLNATEYFGTNFHVSMLPDVLVPSHRLAAVVLALRICFAVMITIGVWARPALALSALLGVWMFLCDRLQFDHVRYSLACYALLLSATACDRSWRAIDGAVPEPRASSFWGVRLAQIQVSFVYLASGGAKLLDPDFREGAVLAARFAPGAPFAAAQELSPRLAEIMSRADVAGAVAKAAIMTELAICVALWLRPTRVVALWSGVWFQASVQLVTGAWPLTLLQLAALGLFVTPDLHARGLRFDPSRPWGALAGALVPMFDWFGRFDVKGWEPDDQPGHSVVVVRRDGTRVTGIRALSMITRCLPVLFPLWAPIALVASFTRQGDLTTRG